MRNLIFTFLLGTGLSLAATNVQAQDHHYVNKHPYATTGARPPRPSSHHLGVGTEWEWKDGLYSEVRGHWDVPPKGHKVWTAGRWSSTKKGSYWVPGHW